MATGSIVFPDCVSDAFDSVRVKISPFVCVCENMTAALVSSIYLVLGVSMLLSSPSHFRRTELFIDTKERCSEHPVKMQSSK